MMTSQLSADLALLLPEIVLALFAMGALLAGAYGGGDRLAPTLNWLTAVMMMALAAVVALSPAGSHTAFYGAFVLDGFTRFAQVVILLAAASILLIGQDYLQKRGLLRFEYPILVSLSVTGMMMMVAAGDLMSLYLGLELQSLALYVIAAMNRDSEKSTEAGLKYFVLGALSSGLILYGASLAYGFAGTTTFSGILAAASNGHLPLGLIFALTFVIAGLSFKVSAVPFHMWTPDVYEGAPTPVTALFATAPKVAAMGLIARVAYDAFGDAIGDWTQIIALLSVLSMFLGAVAGVGQRNIKRLMAYSSIAHMGYALMGLAAGTLFGVQAMLIYMVIYVVMNIGTFSFILSMQKDGQAVTDIRALNHYAAREPLKALAVLVLMFSMAGVPPMVGFFGKFYVLKAAVDANLIWLAVAGALASVISAFYYLRIVYYMYFGEEGEPLDHAMAPMQWVMLVGAALVMLFGVVNMFGLEGYAAAAAEALVK